jgi:GNAT superfamily N-acetyltransferase
MYQAVEPDAETSPLFVNLLPSPVHTLIQDYGRDPGVIILGAIQNQMLLGALSARRNWREPTDCDIENLLVVTPEADDSAVERFLLEKAEERIRARGFRRLQLALKVPRRCRGANSLLTLLQREGWAYHLQWTRFYSTGVRVPQERWYRLEMPEGYDVFPWKQLTAVEREHLLLRAACPDDRRYLDPLIVADFDGSTSLGVRKRSDGSVVGWMITERVSPTLLCFRRLYIVPTERSKGLFFPLLANSIEVMLQQGGRSGTFAVEADNVKMCEVLVRTLGRHCMAILDCFYCSKRLVPDEGDRAPGSATVPFVAPAASRRSA